MGIIADLSERKNKTAVLWGFRPSAPAKAFTTLRVRVRINRKCMFFYIFDSSKKK